MELFQPGYKPSLVMILANLGDIHAERHRKTQRKADLDQAIWALRLALSISSADRAITASLLNNLANGLWRRYRLISDEDDLHQALFFGLRALDFLSQEDPDRSAVLGTLGTIRASLYDCSCEFQDLQDAISITRKSIDIDVATPCAGSSPATLFNNLGTCLWTQYSLTRRSEDLEGSIDSFVKALECQTDNNVDRVTGLINLGQVLAHRYHRTGEMEDLSSALEIALEAMRLDPRNRDLATLLKRLDRFLERRRDPTSTVSWSKRLWLAAMEWGQFLMLLAILLFITATYIYRPRTEILLSIVAFPSGIICHWISRRKASAKRRFSIKSASAAILSQLRGLGHQRTYEYTPRLIAVPSIPIPFSSSLRGIRASDSSAISPFLDDQRRQSMRSGKSERPVSRWPRAIHRRGHDGKVHRGTHCDHRPMSPLCRSNNELQVTTVPTPRILFKPELLKGSFHSVKRSTRLPSVKIARSRNEIGSSHIRGETHLHYSNMQGSVGADSEYGSDITKDGRSIDIEYNDEHQSIVSINAQHDQPNTSLDGYYEPPTPEETKPTNRISSPLVSSHNIWAETPNEYPEHKIWEEQHSSHKEAEKEQARIVRQGHTKHSIRTNSGLAMGNVSSSKAEILGQYIGSPGSRHSTSRALLSKHQNLPTEETPRRSGSEDLRVEEMELVAVDKVIDYTDSASTSASNHCLEVQTQATLTSMVEELIHGQVPRVVEVDDEDPVVAESTGANIDLVEQLTREYLESSSL